MATTDDDVLIERAARLAEEDEERLFLLVEQRKSNGLTQQDVADRIGCGVDKVKRFETHDNDPRMSFVRRYALAVGAHRG